jgi:hypothetical protein
VTITPADAGFTWPSARPLRQCELPHRRINTIRLKGECIVMPPAKWDHPRDFGGEPWKQRAHMTKAVFLGSGLSPRYYRHSHGFVPPYFCVAGLRSRRSLPRHSVALGAEEEGGGWGSCPLAGLALPDEVSNEGLRGVSPGDSRSFANNPLSAIAGGDEITVIGLTMDNRLRLARRNSRREATAAVAHVVQLIPLGGPKDIRLRLAARKSRQDGGRQKATVMATRVAHRQKCSKNNLLRLAA